MYTDGIYEARETVTETDKYGTWNDKYLARVTVFTNDYGDGPMQYGTLMIWRNNVITQSANGLVKDFAPRLAQMQKVA